MKRSSTRSRLFALGALVLGLGLGVLGAEALIRTGKLGWLSHAPLPNTIDPQMFQHRLHPDPAIGFEMRPNSSGQVLAPNTLVNSLGCRGPEPQLEPRPDLLLVALGDSITVGLQVLGEETYSAQLESALSKEFGNVVVLNCGVCGYNLEQSMRRFEDVLAVLQPDGVILGFFVDDYLPPYEMMTGSFRGRLRARSALFRAVEIIWDAARAGKIGTAKEAVASTHGNYPMRVIEYASSWLERRGRDGAKVLAVLHPTLEHPAPRSARKQRDRADYRQRFLPLLEKHSIPWFRAEDLYIEAFGLDGFAEVSTGVDPNASQVDRTTGLDPHPNAKGHLLIAGELGSQIRSLGWLDGLLHTEVPVPESMP